MKLEITVPDGKCGKWAVETFEITERDASYSRVREVLRPGSMVSPGIYKRLMRGNTVVMSNTQMEVRTNRPVIHAATGRVLINGLGLGMVLTAILQKDCVHEVWVIESSVEVIQLVGPSFTDHRVRIIHADAMTYVPPKGVRFDVVWHDIWDGISAANLDEMIVLHRRYAQRTRWQASWARAECEELRRRDRKFESNLLYG